MASDANLIKGAYGAAGGGIANYNLQAAKGMQKISETIGKPIAKELQERTNEFEEFVEYELSREPEMSPANFEAKTKELMDMKSTYMWGDNKSRASIIRKMGQMKIDQENMDDEINNFARKGKGKGSGSGSSGTPKISDAWKFSDTAKEIGKQLKNPEYYYNEDNVLVMDLTVNGVTKPYSKNDIKKLHEQVTVDANANNTVVGLQGQILNDPTKFQLDDGSVDEPLIRYNVKNQIMNGTKYSLANDKIGGKIFKDELASFIGGKEYSELLGETMGLTKDQLIAMDGTKDDDMITPDDVNTIIEELMKDDVLFDNTLEDYYTGLLIGTYNTVSGTPPPTGTQPPPGTTPPPPGTTPPPTGTTLPPPVTANPTAIDIKNSIVKNRNLDKLPAVVNKNALPEITDEVANNIYNYRNDKGITGPFIKPESTTWGSTNVGGGAKDLAEENRKRLVEYGFQVIAKDNDELYIIAPNGEYKYFEYNFWQATNDSKARAEMNRFIKKHLGQKIANIQGDTYTPENPGLVD